MISTDAIRGFTDTMILFLLLEEPSYGYEVSKRIRQLSEERYVMKETTLYSAFTRLSKKGYIESFEGQESNGKQRIYYKITDEGKAYYREKCDEWLQIQSIIPNFININGI